TTAAEVADSNFRRVRIMLEGGVVSAADLDRAKSSRDAANARRETAREQLRLLEGGYRHGQVEAAERNVQAARAQLLASRSRASELVLTAPAGGVVLLRNFLPGEVVSPGQAVVTLGDPEKLWMRVYVAAPELPRVRR